VTIQMFLVYALFFISFIVCLGHMLLNRLLANLSDHLKSFYLDSCVINSNKLTISVPKTRMPVREKCVINFLISHSH